MAIVTAAMRIRPRSCEAWENKFCSFANTEIASEFAKRPSSKARSNTRQRPSDRMPNPHCRLRQCRSARIPRRASRAA